MTRIVTEEFSVVTSQELEELKGATNGLASLDEKGKIPEEQLPDNIQTDEMTGATEDQNGSSGIVPEPQAGDENKVLMGSGLWGELPKHVMYETKADVEQAFINGELKNGDVWMTKEKNVAPTPTPTPDPDPEPEEPDIPDPETSEINDIQTWLQCAEIKDKTYTTLAEVIADGGTLLSLMANADAMTYLARSTGFAEEGCSNATFMQDLGQSPYVDNTVLNSDIWVDAVKNSPYKWLVLECPVYPFSTASDADLAKMLDAYYNGDITIDDIKTKNSVGDSRSISLSAMSATGVGESHRAQTVQFVIGDFEHDDLATAINGHTKAAITLLQKDCLMDAISASNLNNGSNDIERGYMNSPNTNTDGWKSCARRTWCNNVYFNALPSTLQSIVKTVNKKSGTGGGSSSGTETTQDKIFLAAEIEIFGSSAYSVGGEGTQYQYYKNATTNRYKMPKYSSSCTSQYYWERSPMSGNSTCFCRLDYNGSASFTGAEYDNGVAPCLCI